MTTEPQVHWDPIWKCWTAQHPQGFWSVSVPAGGDDPAAKLVALTKLRLLLSDETDLEEES